MRHHLQSNPAAFLHNYAHATYEKSSIKSIQIVCLPYWPSCKNNIMDIHHHMLSSENLHLERLSIQCNQINFKIKCLSPQKKPFASPACMILLWIHSNDNRLECFQCMKSCNENGNTLKSTMRRNVIHLTTSQSIAKPKITQRSWLAQLLSLLLNKNKPDQIQCLKPCTPTGCQSPPTHNLKVCTYSTTPVDVSRGSIQHM